METSAIAIIKDGKQMVVLWQTIQSKTDQLIQATECSRQTVSSCWRLKATGMTHRKGDRFRSAHAYSPSPQYACPEECAVAMHPAKRELLSSVMAQILDTAPHPDTALFLSRAAKARSRRAFTCEIRHQNTNLPPSSRFLGP
jgi:hypothetical protein